MSLFFPKSKIFEKALICITQQLALSQTKCTLPTYHCQGTKTSFERKTRREHEGCSLCYRLELLYPIAAASFYIYVIV